MDFFPEFKDMQLHVGGMFSAHSGSVWVEFARGSPPTLQIYDVSMMDSKGVPAPHASDKLPVHCNSKRSWMQTDLDISLKKVTAVRDRSTPMGVPG